jgi:hypothetical protein
VDETELLRSENDDLHKQVAMLYATLANVVASHSPSVAHRPDVTPWRAYATDQAVQVLATLQPGKGHSLQKQMREMAEMLQVNWNGYPQDRVVVSALSMVLAEVERLRSADRQVGS